MQTFEIAGRPLAIENSIADNYNTAENDNPGLPVVTSPPSAAHLLTFTEVPQSVTIFTEVGPQEIAHKGRSPLMVPREVLLSEEEKESFKLLIPFRVKGKKRDLSDFEAPKLCKFTLNISEYADIDPSKDRDTAIRRSIFKQDIYTYVKVSVSSTDPYTVKFDKNGKRSHVEFNFEMEVHSVYRMTWDFSVRWSDFVGVCHNAYSSLLEDRDTFVDRSHLARILQLAPPPPSKMDIQSFMKRFDSTFLYERLAWVYSWLSHAITLPQVWNLVMFRKLVNSTVSTDKAKRIEYAILENIYLNRDKADKVLLVCLSYVDSSSLFGRWLPLMVDDLRNKSFVFPARELGFMTQEKENEGEEEEEKEKVPVQEAEASKVVPSSCNQMRILVAVDNVHRFDREEYLGRTLREAIRSSLFKEDVVASLRFLTEQTKVEKFYEHAKGCHYSQYTLFLECNSAGYKVYFHFSTRWSAFVRFTRTLNRKLQNVKSLLTNEQDDTLNEVSPLAPCEESPLLQIVKHCRRFSPSTTNDRANAIEKYINFVANNLPQVWSLYDFVDFIQIPYAARHRATHADWQSIREQDGVKPFLPSFNFGDPVEGGEGKMHVSDDADGGHGEREKDEEAVAGSEISKGRLSVSGAGEVRWERRRVRDGSDALQDDGEKAMEALAGERPPNVKEKEKAEEMQSPVFQRWWPNTRAFFREVLRPTYHFDEDGIARPGHGPSCQCDGSSSRRCGPDRPMRGYFYT